MGETEEAPNGSGESPHELLALSPLDGRYAAKVLVVREIFNEMQLMKQRTYVEIEWFIKLASLEQMPLHLSADHLEALRTIARSFNVNSAQRVKQIEKITNHDLKAVEYYIKEKLEATKDAVLMKNAEYIHFACTSEDINNVAYGRLMKRLLTDVMVPEIERLLDVLKEMASRFAMSPILAQTHGQPASPTTFGKELCVFLSRLQKQLNTLRSIKVTAKFNGAVGNFNAHYFAEPAVDWIEVSADFVSSMGLEPNTLTTQIEPHDFIAEICNTMALINTILIDLCTDMWLYVSRGILKLRIVAAEVGSSTMPHKVNPIAFENAEGNAGLANALLQLFANKLPRSRLQRDLSDSTVLRNLGVAFGYSYLSYVSAREGLTRVDLDQKTADAELSRHWEVVAEGIQTLLRKRCVEGAYEMVKDSVRVDRGTRKADIEALIQQVDDKLTEEDVNSLKALTPATYIGAASRLVSAYLKDSPE